MPTTTTICDTCGSDFTRTHAACHPPKYCSRRCSTIARNAVRGARDATGRLINRRCPNCDGVKYYKSLTCGNCARSKPKSERAALTLGTLREQFDTLAYHAKIRMWARAACPDRACVVCGYDKHIDVCHIRAVKDFPVTATIAEVNAISNLVPLCPNHHWEFDNGYLAW